MANPVKTKAKLEKIKANVEADVEVARAKTEAKIAKADAKLHVAEARAAADVEAAINKADTQLAKDASGRSDKKSAKQASQQMSEQTTFERATETPQIKPPQCARCGKTVESLTVLPHPHDASKSIVEYQCHGEAASQEISSSELAEKQGLSSYTMFNAFTSGMMPKQKPIGETAKKAGQK